MLLHILVDNSELEIKIEVVHFHIYLGVLLLNEGGEVSSLPATWTWS